MQADEKLLVRQLVGELLREEAPAHLAEFERDFDDLYGSVEDRLRELRHEELHGDWKLPFDAAFGAGVFVGTIIGVAAFLVREALAVADKRQRERRLKKLQPQLLKQTGSPELVLALCARVLDLIERMPTNWTEPPDLELQVHLTSVPGGTALTYVLHSAIAGFHFEKIPGPDLKMAPEAFATSLLEQLERLHEGYDIDGGLLLPEEAEKELASLGQSLFRELFPREMRQAYRRFHKAVRTVQITSDEPAIPWELIKPYDDEEGPLIDDDFFCIHFELTRWRNGRPPVSAFQLRKLACLGDTTLPNTAKERDLLTGLTTRHANVEDASPRSVRYREVESLLEKGGCDLLHFIGHGDVSPERANEARIILEDRPFRARNLTGAIQTRLKKDRPLVFLNACRVARQDWSLTGLGGWVEALVRRCECGAFLGPQWVVKDSLAYEFARVFYYELEQGRTLGEAAQAARNEVKQKDPGRPTWLAYAVYGHPNARMTLGIEQDPPAIGGSSQPAMVSPASNSTRSLAAAEPAASDAPLEVSEESHKLRPAEMSNGSTEVNLATAHRKRYLGASMTRSDNQADDHKLHEAEPVLMGRWKGTWENLINKDKGEEMIEVIRQENGEIEGQFFDLSTHDITIKFRGQLRFGNLFIRYWAPKGQRIMQDGCCFLKLQNNGNWEGYYADFSGCGRYELKLDRQR
jgi:CHAT domain-containing protein